MKQQRESIQQQLMRPVLKKHSHRVHLRNAGLSIASVILDNRVSTSTIKRDLEDLREAIDLAIKIVADGGSNKLAVNLH